MLTANEYQSWDSSALRVYGLKVSQELEHGGFRFLVFGENIAAKIPGWDTKLSNPLFFPVTSKTLHQTGQLIQNPAGEFSLRSEIGESGFLHYGFPIDLEKGVYEVDFDLGVVDEKVATNGSATIDVLLDNQEQIATGSIKSNDGKKSLSFNLNRPRTIEFRVAVNGSSGIELRGFTVKRLTNQDS